MPGLILHGGAGRPRPRAERAALKSLLAQVAEDAWSQVKAGQSAVHVAVEAARALEDMPLFNAGTGSKLQSDGAARLSAALMDGHLERFSGVVNVEGILNPILLCRQLQQERDRVLSGAGALQRARELGLREGDVRTEAALQSWREAIEGETGTIGAVVCDLRGHIAAATSTGGRGMEGIGRVSDSATVAGNFASPNAGVSCTGIGEDIVDGALAARAVAAVDSGLAIEDATARVRERMVTRQWAAGLIALDRQGRWSAIHTTAVMYWTAIDDQGLHQFDFPDLP